MGAKRACTGAGATHAYAPTNISDIPDDLMECILLRVSSPVCLVRAAATCRPWRRAIAGDVFLRHFGSLHGPHVLGHFLPMKSYCKVLEFVPTAVDNNNIKIESVELGFLPYSTGSRWKLADSRNGLVAFVDPSFGIVVCDPWTREFAVLPPWTGGQGSSNCLGAFLLDGDDTGNSPHMSRFRVLCVRLVLDFDNERYVAMSYLFTARDNRWFMLSSTDAGNVVLARLLKYTCPVDDNFVGRVAGSIFWSAGADGAVLELDESTGEFSVFTLPPPVRVYGRCRLRVIAGDACALCLVRIVDDDLEVLTCVRGGGGASTVDRRVDLASLADDLDVKGWNFAWRFWDTASVVCPWNVVLSPDYWFRMFSVDVKAVWMESVELNNRDGHVRVVPYELPWPPTIRACLP